MEEEEAASQESELSEFEDLQGEAPGIKTWVLPGALPAQPPPLADQIQLLTPGRVDPEEKRKQKSRSLSPEPSVPTKPVQHQWGVERSLSFGKTGTSQPQAVEQEKEEEEEEEEEKAVIMRRRLKLGGSLKLGGQPPWLEMVNKVEGCGCANEEKVETVVGSQYTTNKITQVWY